MYYVDFWDFMMEGGDELLNTEICPYCGSVIYLDQEIEWIDEEKRRIQAYGIHLRRLVYLSKEEFKFLKFLRFCFLKKARKFFAPNFCSNKNVRKDFVGSNHWLCLKL